MVAFSSSSSLEHSETSAHSYVPTACQKTMHARDWQAWYQTHSALRVSGEDALVRRGERIAACCCCPVFCLTSADNLRLAPGFCRDRVCPTCAHRRSRQTFHDLAHAVSRMDAPRFITLTQKAKNEPLFMTLARLRGNFRTLRKLPVWTEAVRGGVYSIEVTRNADTKLWHAHIHVIADGTFLAQDRLSAAWRAASGDSYIVDIRAIHSRTSVASYITKYISKPADLHRLPSHAFYEYARDMAGVRTIHAFGNCHARDKDEQSDGCIAVRAQPLVTSATLLRRVRMGCVHASHAIHLLNRMGGNFRRACGLPQPPDDEPLDQLTPLDKHELIGHLIALTPHQSVTEIPRSVHRLADLRCDMCPFP